MNGKKDSIYLSSLRIINFLSYYEAMVTFSPGLNMVVGANGSGKTALLEAIRYGLGSDQLSARYRSERDFIRFGANHMGVEIELSVNGEKRFFSRSLDRHDTTRYSLDGRRVGRVSYKKNLESLEIRASDPIAFFEQEIVNSLRGADPKSLGACFHNCLKGENVDNLLLRVEREINDLIGNEEYLYRIKKAVSNGDLSLEHSIISLDKSRIPHRFFTGGNRALFAVAFILALMKVRESPLYIIDEIDVFLDATNVETIGGLLKEMSLNNQFIITTPAKSLHLLRHADKLIGVASPKRLQPSVIVTNLSFRESRARE